MSQQTVEKILKFNSDFNKTKLEKAINLIGGENVVCLRHLKLMLSLNPDELSVLVYLLNEYTNEEQIPIRKIEKTFGRQVAEMMSSIRSVLELPISKNAKPDVIRRMFLTLAKDFRVVMILLVDKLADLEHLHAEKSPRMKALAKEAMEIYIPIATRLGIYEIKTRMEDVCFEVLHPDDFKRVTSELEEYSRVSNEYIGKAKKELKDVLDSMGINAEISGRMKHPYSVYKKMNRKQKTNVTELFDIYALRIILDDQFNDKGVEDVSQCYSVLGLIHSQWRPLARRFKDYIAVPKVNGYRSLHTTILGLTPDVRDEPTEVQIRTRTMHQEAEFGIASHWWYKDGKTGETAVKDDKVDVKDKRVRGQLEWLKGLADLHKEIDNEEAMGHKIDLFSDHIFVLTPNGDIKDLPQGSTPIDFAYLIHTDVGHTCTQAKVNGSIVPLDSELKNGDCVQIITRKGSEPSRYWLSFVKTHGAQYRIKNYFRMQDRENNLKVGRELINKELVKLNKPMLDPSLTQLEVFAGKELSFKEREFVLECVGNGHYSTKQVLKKMLPEDELVTTKNLAPVKMVQFKEVDRVKEKGTKIIISGENDIPVSFASCCSPSFGMPITGYVGRGQTVKVHDANCEEIENLESERFVDVSWAETNGYFVTLEIKTDDSHDISSLIWDKLKHFKTETKELSTVAKVRDGVVRKLFIKVQDLEELHDVMDRIEHIDGVVDIRKVS